MKQSALILLFFGLLGSTIYAQSLSKAQVADMERLFTEHYKADRSGATVMITQKGKTLYHKAFGMANLELNVPMRTEHVFRIGSITKQLTAAAILKLAEEGKLNIQDELTQFIPDYPTQGKKITIEHLLTHTSGIQSYTDMPEWDAATHRKDFTPEEMIKFFKDKPMNFDPGTEFRYNNSGYFLLGYIIEKASGKTYGEYIRDAFFKPLGMKNSYYGDTEPLIKNRASGYSQGNEDGTQVNAPFLSMTQPYAAGSLLSTVEDLNLWSQALHNGKVLQPASYQAMITPYRLSTDAPNRYAYGLQIGNLLGSPTIEHSGGIHGFLSDMIYLPKEELCVAILTNCDCEPPSELTPRLAALVTGRPYQPEKIPVDAQQLEQYVGVYENDAKEQRVIRLENGQLTSQRAGSSKFNLFAYGPDQFFFENSFARIRFEKDKSGKKVIQAIVDDRSGANLKWIKTDKPLPAARQEMQRSEAQLQPFEGEYELAPGFSIKVTREGTQLFGQATGQPRFEMYSESPTRFFLKVVDAAIEFYPDEKGTVNKMVLFQGGREMPGVRK
ncbi:MAG TPA: serine hydrolase [Saprospirales bacterium]|nr:serine hydrolase [Saprospirales bacterium]